MAVKGRKITNFTALNTLTGEEFLMASYKGRTYKVPVSLFLGNKINEFNQIINANDGEDNPLTITLSDGRSQTFHIYNGKTGQTGQIGPKGPTGDPGPTGVALYDLTTEDIFNLIVNSLTGEGYTDEELMKKGLSAYMGKQLNDQVSLLKEVYFETQEEFDRALSRNEIEPDTKYFIFEE